jgi:hypothetical protein
VSFSQSSAPPTTASQPRTASAMITKRLCRSASRNTARATAATTSSPPMVGVAALSSMISLRFAL